MLTFLLSTMLILARESETTTETVPMTGLTATAPAADLAWNVAVNLWQDTKPPAAPGPVPPPPGSDAQPVAAESVATASDSAAPADTETDYVFVIESELLPIGTLVMTQDRVIKTLGASTGCQTAGRGHPQQLAAAQQCPPADRQHHGRRVRPNCGRSSAAGCPGQRATRLTNRE